MTKCQKWVVRQLLGVIFFNFCDLGESNQKMVVHNLKERQKNRVSVFLRFVDPTDSFRENWIFVKKSQKFSFACH